jgi:thiamine biosynthesis lipoprotein
MATMPRPRAKPRLTRRQLLSLTRPAPRSDREESGHWIRVHRAAMACRFEITLSGEDAPHVPAAREALDAVDRIEDALTVFRDGSEVSRVNREAGKGPVEVSPLLFALLVQCQALHAASEGAFDPTSAPLSRCWGFLARQGRLPAADDIEDALRRVGMDAVELDPDARMVRFARPGVELNFGSIGKGYALDFVRTLLREKDVPRALVSAAGSSVIAFGGGDGFQVDVRSRRVEGVLARLWLQETALGTSGTGEQFFEAEGRRYGHVLDPRTGWPAEGVLSVSVVTAEAAAADALSTAFLVGGSGLAERYCAAHPGTLAFVTLEGEPTRVLRFGSCAGVTVEEV